MPFGAPRLFYSNGSKVKMSVWGLLTMTTNSLENPITKNLETFFLSFFFALTLWSWHLFFFFVLFFFLFFDLSTSGNDACYRWPSKLKHLFLVWRLFWKVDLLVQSCFYHSCLKRGLWLKSVPEKWVIVINVPQGINQRWFESITILGTFVFGHRKGIGRLEVVASLDAYQITNCQFLSKTHHFYCLIFEEFEK